jgi:hypothetical protein
MNNRDRWAYIRMLEWDKRLKNPQELGISENKKEGKNNV